MDQLLDLCITLIPPPADASPETIAGIELRCDQLGLQHKGDILEDPLTAKDHENIRWYLEEYAEWPYEQFLERGKKIESSLAEFGKRLYQTVFGSAGAMSVVQPWRLQPGAQRQVSIVSELPRALSLPWELLHDEQGFLVLRTRNPVSLIRRLPQSELAGFPTPFEPPLRILLLTARPDDAGFIDPRSIARELLDEVQQVDAGAIVLEFLRPPTLGALRTRLSDSKLPPIHVLHFDGHGVFGEELDGRGKRLSSKKQGMLAFENDEGKLNLVKAEDLAGVLQDSGVRLAVLTACQSAVGAADDAFSSVAAQLIRSGVDAVTAMSASVLVVSASRYAEAFYRALAGGFPAPLAQERARQALHDDPRRNVHRRRTDDEGTFVTIRDWWLPHYYQQRPVLLQPTKPVRKRKSKKASAGVPLPRLSESMPPEPRYNFSGRAHELLQIERYLLRGKLVVLHGFGGIGKTALAREAADWLTRTQFYAGACFVSFEHGGDATTLLSSLGNYLGVYDGSYNPNDTKAALAKLGPVLKAKRTLVIADNLESILPRGDAPLEVAVRTQLWDVLLELAKLGAGVLLTTRDTSFGDGRFAPGSRTAHLLLQGLHPDDAYALATRLLTDLGIDRARAPYAELRDLLVQLDHHPLAIQLVLPALRTFPLATIRADFVALLPKFVDDTETGRNRSLLASLEYSLRRLSDAQQSLLPRLTLFEGGALEENLLAITEIPENDWATLRPALEQAALLTAEQVHDAIPAPFLHFHPVLTPYLRAQPSADDAALRERYTQRYCALADYLYHEDNRHPQPMRALVQRELPNLRRALELLLEAGELNTASDMADSIARFLTFFGLRRERDELRRWVDQAVARTNTQEGDVLTWAEFLHESGLGEDEYRKGHLPSAYARFTKLLARIDAQQEGAPLGRGSYDHCLTLGRLARCLRTGGQAVAAEMRLREALVLIDALIKQQPDNQNRIRHRGMLLADMGDILLDQGKYPQARGAYEEALNVAKQQDDPRPQAVALAQLGMLALEQRDYAEARSRYTEVLKLFQALGEPALQAGIWRNLGTVAQKQNEWTEAERYYRESLAICERLGDTFGAASTCTQLGSVAKYAGRPTEAEGWYKRALELDEHVDPGGSSNAIDFNNLAGLLVNEEQADPTLIARLTEAKGYAERALAILEKLDVSAGIWKTLHILADIADLEGRTEAAQDYRRRERETFAAFAGNRYHIDLQFGSLIAAIAAAAKSDMQARKKVEASLPEGEANGWHIAAATQRIWAGGRDWHSLVEDLGGQEALLVLRVLETIAQPTQEEVIASLPSAIREVLEGGDDAAFERAFQALSPDEQHKVEEAMRYLQALNEKAEEEPA